MSINKKNEEEKLNENFIIGIIKIDKNNTK